MRILVFSDSHGELRRCIQVVESIVGVDMILHAGDHARDAALLSKAFPDIPVHYVRGNCDGDYAPAERIIEADGKRIFLTHGHLYKVKQEFRYDTLAIQVAAEDCDLGVFGHTHLEYTGENAGVQLLNPGSIRECGTYGVIEIENGVLKTAVLSTK